MFSRIKQRLSDMKTLSRLCDAAESHSVRRNEGEPGPEHFVLAAIDMPDGSAKLIFESLDLDAAEFEDALREQYKQSLIKLGLDVDDSTLVSRPNSEEKPESTLYTATQAATELLQVMSKQKRRHALSGADVLCAIDQIPSGPTHRALQFMGTTAEHISTAAKNYWLNQKAS